MDITPLIASQSVKNPPITLRLPPMQTIPGTLYILAAPSGTGKTSLARGLAGSLDNINTSISYTTRPQRPNEIDGVDYHFVTPEQFAAMLAQGCFLEHAQIFAHSYGTAKQQVEAALSSGKDLILAIDWQGARQVRRLFADAVSVFVLPPSPDLLRERLHHRQQDSEGAIKQRLAGASDDVSHYQEFDYLLINDVFALALTDLQAIVRASRVRRAKQSLKYQALLAELAKKL